MKQYGDEFKPSLDFDDLEHFGVKGMHWGVRNSRNSAEEKAHQLSRINRKLIRINGNTAFEGQALRNYGGQKVFDSMIKSNPNFNYSKLSPSEKDAYQKRITRRTYGEIAKQGAIAGGIVLAAGAVSSSINKTPHQAAVTNLGSNVASVILAVSLARSVHAVRVANRLDKLQKQRDALGGTPAVSRKK